MNIKTTTKSLVEFAIKNIDRKAGAPTFTFDGLQEAVAYLEERFRDKQDAIVPGTIFGAEIYSDTRNAIAKVERRDTGWWITSMRTPFFS